MPGSHNHKNTPSEQANKNREAIRNGELHPQMYAEMFGEVSVMWGSS